MSVNILPADPTAAVEMLIEITARMKAVMEEEARSIVRGSEAAMQDVESLKNKILPQYEQAAAEFSQRVEEFRGVRKSLLDEMQGLQDALAAVTRENQFHLAT